MAKANNVFNVNVYDKIDCMDEQFQLLNSDQKQLISMMMTEMDRKSRATDQDLFYPAITLLMELCADLNVTKREIAKLREAHTAMCSNLLDG